MNIFSRRVKEAGEAFNIANRRRLDAEDRLRQYEREVAYTESACIKVLSRFGVEAVDAFHETLEAMKDRNV